MLPVPAYIIITFVLTTLLTVIIFAIASSNARITLFILTGWVVLQAIAGFSGFYLTTDTLPPRFVLLVFPPLLLISLLFVTPGGKRFIDKMDPGLLTLLHSCRIPVELVLFWLSLQKAVPGLMTFEGRNFDIVSGLTAPAVYYFGYVKKLMSSKILIVWHLACLVLLFNIVIHAILSAPSPLQQFAFEQPNIAVLYFPFVWLPCCVVPLVLLSHLAVLRQLKTANKSVQKTGKSGNNY
ncbi:hypothetical protein EXU57_19210 [Segetibacter sp. 3557_3]|uniref:hypothetical protein n=1 Tax=Segetibacter sp. 3557_3 TaxID=2547429 RepID=UPI00105857AB|nr:hypothetical protein [Segetibacter sp. 3557_3]TDH21633.1 hypothetical protein EXU57_19210 [Segetibacter sp. 3557_3]